MRHRIYTLLITILLLAFVVIASWRPGPQASQEQFTPLTNLPITTKDDEAGELLRKWHKNGTAAGNTGDFYDNRDGGHSLLDIAPYPQLQKIEYSEQQIKTRQNWGMQQKTLPYVVFGNSSTSAAPESGGSNVRSYYVDPRGLLFLFYQYTRNNIYIYPEHQDHDPGHNGMAGFGDLYPTNTPYLITSQGSSGSDQPFMKALPPVLAAFQPQVKKKLIQSGLLMPVIQMILRITSKNLKNEKEYLTGKAHPTVFQGANVDVLAMVEMAHKISLSDIPPVAVIQVVHEDTPALGIDYFDPEHTEKLADTPAAIARVFRGSKYLRKMRVSAEGSKDLNNKPLKFHWTILRGDPCRIKIEYLNSARSVADIALAYHPRRPIHDGADLESNRVDLGIFAHNGSYYSPPAFITFYSLDNEARSYRSDGQPLEIGYGAGSSHIAIADWKAFFDCLDAAPGSLAGSLLQKRFTPAEKAELLSAGRVFREVYARRVRAEDALKSNLNLPAARKTAEEAREAETALLQGKLQSSNLSIAETVNRAIYALLRDSELCSANAAQLARLYESSQPEARKRFDEIHKKLQALGIIANTGSLSYRPRVPAAEMSEYAKGMVEQLNAFVLGQFVFPGIAESRWRENYVDHRLAASKEWRDVYQYSQDGVPQGWKRYQSGGTLEFDQQGRLTGVDAQGHRLPARAVKYEVEPNKSDPLRKRVKMILN